MRTALWASIVVSTVVLAFATACSETTAEQGGADAGPAIRVNLPPVPTLPPPPHPVTYPDGTYSVYGMRHRLRHVIDTEARVKAYILEIYQAPPCPARQTCPTARMPHVWIADDLGEREPSKRMRVTGYAESQRDIDRAIAEARRGRRPPTAPEGEGLPPIPTDFAVGRQYTFQGRLTRMSGNGFLDSEGLLDYRGHAPADAATGGAAPGAATPGAAAPAPAKSR